MHLKRRINWPPGVSALDALNDYMWQRHLAEKKAFIVHCIQTRSTRVSFLKCTCLGLQKNIKGFVR